MKQPKPTLGIRHIALFVNNFEACEAFYTQTLGMIVEWRPDPDNVYLSSGSDNLALHRASTEFDPDKTQRLDHFGFIVKTAEEVDEWHQYCLASHVKVSKGPITHRDGARSFYCEDPDGNHIQLMYHPPISD